MMQCLNLMVQWAKAGNGQSPQNERWYMMCTYLNACIFAVGSGTLPKPGDASLLCHSPGRMIAPVRLAAPRVCKRCPDVADDPMA